MLDFRIISTRSFSIFSGTLASIEPTVTLVTNDFIRDELATLPSATPYQRGMVSERVPSYASSIASEPEDNPGQYLV